MYLVELKEDFGDRMVVGDEVRLYQEDDWFFEGRISKIEGRTIEVDFDDWVSEYSVSDVRTKCVYYKDFLTVGSDRGRIIKDFRNHA